MRRETQTRLANPSHAQMIQEMAKFHAKDRGTGMDSNLTLARIIEIMYRAWKDKQVILHDNVTPETASRAIVEYQPKD